MSGHFKPKHSLAGSNPAQIIRIRLQRRTASRPIALSPYWHLHSAPTAAMEAAAPARAEFGLMSWYMEIPVVSRLYFTLAFLTTAGCALDIISPFMLYYNFDLIFSEGQVWRLFTSYLFFGYFSVDFLFHMYFLVRYCRLLEEGDFRGRTANFVLMLAFGVTMMTLVAPFLGTGGQFLGNALTFMMTYTWGRRNQHAQMAFLGAFTFSAPYLPFVMLAFSLLMGNSVQMDVVGIFVGHTYYFLEYVYPTLAKIRGWRVKRIMEPPRILHMLCGTYREDVHLHED